MSQLVDALVARLDRGKRADRDAGESDLRRRLTAGAWRPAGRQKNFDALIMAAPAWAAGALLEPVDAALGSELGRHSVLVVDHREPDL